MTFDLTDSLLEAIKSALDNQNEKFLVDAEKKELVLIDSVKSMNSERYYELPGWTSADGFKMREDFVNQVYSPLAREELQEVLHSGRGVFRNFKNILKSYPEVDKRWHLFKNRIMNGYINQWYNDLREIWGLEKLDYLPDSDETLIYDDFTFGNYSSELHKQEILQQISVDFKENRANLPENLTIAFYDLWLQQFENGDRKKQTGFVCRGLSEDFAGCVTAAPVSDNQSQVFILTSLFVSENFRGLGIGTELLFLCLTELKENGAKWVLLPDIIMPESIQPLLCRTGFEKIGSGYAVKLQ